MMAMTVGMYVIVARDDSSTAGLGIAFLPAYLWIAVGVAFCVRPIARE